MELIPYSRQSISDEDISLVKKVMSSDFLTQGPFIKKFENALESKLGVKHAVVCSNGTAALHLSYASCGINQESLGIVPAITFAATANALRYQGAKVQFCDVDPNTGMICVDSLEESLSQVSGQQKEKCNVVAPVSFAGATAPLYQCKNLSDQNNFVLIEDASHSPGSWGLDPKGEKVYSANGDYALASTLSFHPVKHVCSGEGGAVLTNDNKLAEKASRLRSHGINRPFHTDDEKPWYYEQIELGWNYRLTDMQAALGLSQLNRLDQFLTQRRYLAARYDRILKDTPFNKDVVCPPFQEGHAWHLYVIKFKNSKIRNSAYKFFKSENILTQVHYIPLYKHPYYQKHFGSKVLPGAEEYFKTCLSIPIYPDLKEKEQDRVIETLEKFLQKG